ncbi:MAG TPA: methyltransferase domain-containing protein [Dehalococcoidia bacterium]|nr:methyltransferase domain-containing protein [Dehalococcoidia bacterium]
MSGAASPTSEPDSDWTGGDAYEQYVGRWSRLVAREFVAWLEAPPGLRWLDVGCGTGELTRAIASAASPASVIGVDQSEKYVAYARERTPAIDYRVGNATALPVENASLNVAVSGLVLNFVAQPQLAVAEMARATGPGGIAAAYVWDYADGTQFMRNFWDAAKELQPSAALADEGARFALCNEAGLREAFESTSLQKVQTREIVVPTHFLDFNDYWNPFLGGQGPAGAFVLSLPPQKRDQLRAILHERIAPTGGSIELTARAWAVKGAVPDRKA